MTFVLGKPLVIRDLISTSFWLIVGIQFFFSSEIISVTIVKRLAMKVSLLNSSNFK